MMEARKAALCICPSALCLLPFDSFYYGVG